MGRVVSLDVLRGFALLGILLLNIVSFGLPFAAYLNPTVAGGAARRQPRRLVPCHDLLGRQDAGDLLDAVRRQFRRVSRGPTGGRPRQALLRRTLWLIVFGLLHAHLLWSGDILYPYGVIGLLLYLFRPVASAETDLDRGSDSVAALAVNSAVPP
jgi:uncharacterized protein